jgi:hypothetical protein
MTDDFQRPAARSALLSFRFILPAFAGSLVMALVSACAPPAAQIAALGGLVSILAGLFLAYLEQEDARERRRTEALERLAVPLALAPHPDLDGPYRTICRALTELARSGDPILREMAGLKLASVAGQVASLATGTVVFAGTEAWRTVYERLLQSPDLKEYCSVAWVRSRDYWHDEPGRQSLAANFAAADRGVLIERLLILPDDLWPPGAPLPDAALLPWIEGQHNAGLWITLVRESALAQEPELLGDLGIYGNRAVGIQELDDRCRTVRFTLTFDPAAVRLARERWQRLALFATSFRRLLDNLDTDE